MQTDPEDIECRHDPDAGRYEIAVGGRRVGVATYRDTGDALVFDHTEIDPAAGGRGLGGRLAAYALDDVRRRGRTVVPACPFIAHVIDTHPEYRDLLAARP